MGDDRFVKQLKIMIAELTLKFNIARETGRRFDPDMESVINIMQRKLDEVRKISD